MVSGQRFHALIISEDCRHGHNIPHGRWRDGIFDCCTLGCCNSQFCLTFWFPACALGQILTRMKLDACGRPLNGRELAWSAFKLFFFLTAVYMVMCWVTEIIVDTYDVEEVDTLFCILEMIGFLFVLIVTIRARAHIRGRYNIPEKRCVGCEDCCCAFFCSPCTICQMSRHTADYHKYGSACCTEDGLIDGAPDVV